MASPVKETHDQDRFVRDACNSTEALRSLYTEMKRTRKSCSLAVLCRKLGMSSTGYLSDILSGRRVVHPKYLPAVSQTFDLSENGRVCMKLLVSIDLEKDLQKRASLLGQLKLARKSLQVSFQTMPDQLRAEDLFLALDVFCALGIVPAAATRQTVGKIFTGKRSQESVDASLQLLEELGLITWTGECCRATEELLMFEQRQREIVPTQFIKLALDDAKDQVGEWFSQPENSFFSSTALSVDQQEFKEILKSFKTFTQSTLSSLERKDANAMIRFNVQIYPIFLAATAAPSSP